MIGLEPVCLDEFIFSSCHHPGADCSRHRYETLADQEGGRVYSSAEWKQIKEVDPVAMAQMIERIRARNHTFRS